MELLEHQLERCAVCIIVNEGLIRKIYLPKLVFPISRVLIGLMTFVFSLGAMFLLLWPLGARPSPSMLFLPLIIGLFAIFTLGLSLIVATANTFFRDCGHLVSVFLQAWYFVTPIIYPVNGDVFPESAGGFSGSIRRTISSNSSTMSCTRGDGPVWAC